MKPRRKHFCLIIVFIALLGILCFFNLYFKLYAFKSVSDKKLSVGVSIMTFNVAAYDSTKFTPSIQKELLELIKQEQPDIVCFQELSFENLSKIKPQLDSIYGPCQVLTGDNQLWRLRFYSYYPLKNFKRLKCDGDISTDDMTEAEVSFIEKLQKQMGVMSAEFEVKPGKWLTLFSGHLRSSAYSTARRSMSKDSHWWEGIPLYYKNYEIGKRIRDYQARNVRRFIDKACAEGKTVIVAGDLNDWCGSTTLNTLMGEGDNALKDAWWEGGNGFGFTYQGWHLRLRLDHILYSDGVELNDVRVIDSDLSDHKPLVADFHCDV